MYTVVGWKMYVLIEQKKVNKRCETTKARKIQKDKTMRFCIAPIIIAAGSAFTPTITNSRETTKIEATRRETLALIGGAVCFPDIAGAFSQQLGDFAFEPQQQATDDKLDLDSAFVSGYKGLPGFFPTAAGKIASNGIDIDSRSEEQRRQQPQQPNSNMGLFPCCPKQFQMMQKTISRYLKVVLDGGKRRARGKMLMFE